MNRKDSLKDKQLLKEKIWQAIENVRQREPLILCLTNYVVNNFTANVLLASGTSPIIAKERSEMKDLVKISSGLLLNIGTLDRQQLRAMKKALSISRRTKIPVILDMVGVGMSQWRRSAAQTLLKKGKISVLHGNASEVISFMKDKNEEQNEHVKQDILEMAALLSQRYEVVVAVSGKVDYVVDATSEAILQKKTNKNQNSSLLQTSQAFGLSNGHAWLTKTTGVGCALGALITAIHACGTQALIASLAATSFMNISAEIAIEKITEQNLGLASMQAYLLDQIYMLQESDFHRLVAIDFLS